MVEPVRAGVRCGDQEKAVYTDAGLEPMALASEVFVRINGETSTFWRAVDHEGEDLEAFVTKRDRKTALRY